jgi:hypothetical protein
MATPKRKLLLFWFKKYILQEQRKNLFFIFLLTLPVLSAQFNISTLKVSPAWAISSSN